MASHFPNTSTGDEEEDFDEAKNDMISKLSEVIWKRFADLDDRVLQATSIVNRKTWPDSREDMESNL